MNNYQVYEEIGRGKHSSVVYKGRKKKSIEYFAIVSYDKNQKDRVLRNVQQLRVVNNNNIDQQQQQQLQQHHHHPNILKFFNWYETSNHYWLVMELCTGGTLADVLKIFTTTTNTNSTSGSSNNTFGVPLPTLKAYARDLLIGLRYCHHKGVVYNDIKPSNILLDDEATLKYYDFTNSVLLNNNNNSPSAVSQTFSSYSSYAAPEILLQDAPPSFSSDLYSLGALLYELATGKPAFTVTSTTNKNNHNNNITNKTLRKRKQNHQQQQQQAKSGLEQLGGDVDDDNDADDDDFQDDGDAELIMAFNDLHIRNNAADGDEENNARKLLQHQTKEDFARALSQFSTFSATNNFQQNSNSLHAGLLDLITKIATTTTTNTPASSPSSNHQQQQQLIASYRNLFEFIEGTHCLDPVKRWDWSRVLESNFVREDLGFFVAVHQPQQQPGADDSNINNNNSALIIRQHQQLQLQQISLPLPPQSQYDEWLQSKLVNNNNNNNNGYNIMMMKPSASTIAAAPPQQQTHQTRTSEVDETQHFKVIASHNSATPNEAAAAASRSSVRASTLALIVNNKHEKQATTLTQQLPQTRELASTSSNNNNNNNNNIFIDLIKLGSDFSTCTNSNNNNSNSFSQLFTSTIKPILHNHRIERIADNNQQYDAEQLYNSFVNANGSSSNNNVKTVLPNGASSIKSPNDWNNNNGNNNNTQVLSLLLEQYLGFMFDALVSGNTSMSDKHNILAYLEALFCVSSTSTSNENNSSASAATLMITLIANTVVNSTLINVLVTMLNMSHVPAALCTQLLTILAKLFRFATFIDPNLLKSGVVETITAYARHNNNNNDTSSPESTSSSPPKVRRRALAALGELLFYAVTSSSSTSSTSSSWKFPSAVYETIFNSGLTDTDEVCKHYSVKTIENILLSFDMCHYQSATTNDENNNNLLYSVFTKEFEAANSVMKLFEIFSSSNNNSASPSSTSSSTNVMSKTDHMRMSALNSAFRYSCLRPEYFASTVMSNTAGFDFGKFLLQQTVPANNNNNQQHQVFHHKLIQSTLTFIGLHLMKYYVESSTTTNICYLPEIIILNTNSNSILKQSISLSSSSSSLAHRKFVESVFLSSASQFFKHFIHILDKHNNHQQQSVLLLLLTRVKCLVTLILFLQCVSIKQQSTSSSASSSFPWNLFYEQLEQHLLTNKDEEINEDEEKSSRNNNNNFTVFNRFLASLSNSANMDMISDVGLLSSTRTVINNNTILTSSSSNSLEQTDEAELLMSISNNNNNQLVLLQTGSLKSTTTTTTTNTNSNKNNNNNNKTALLHSLVRYISKKTILMLRRASTTFIHQELLLFALNNNNNNDASSLETIRRTTVLLQFAANGLFQSILLDKGEMLQKAFVEGFKKLLMMMQQKNNNNTATSIMMMIKLLQILECSDLDFVSAFSTLSSLCTTSSNNNNNNSVRNKILQSTLALTEICGATIDNATFANNNNNTSTTINIRCSALRILSNIIFSCSSSTNNNTVTTSLSSTAKSSSMIQQQHQQQAEDVVIHLLRKEGKVHEQFANQLSNILNLELKRQQNQLSETLLGSGGELMNDDEAAIEELQTSILTSAVLSLRIACWFCDNASPAAFIERIARDTNTVRTLLHFAVVQSTTTSTKITTKPDSSCQQLIFQLLASLIKHSPAVYQLVSNTAASTMKQSNSNNSDGDMFLFDLISAPLTRISSMLLLAGINIHGNDDNEEENEQGYLVDADDHHQQQRKHQNEFDHDSLTLSAAPLMEIASIVLNVLVKTLVGAVPSNTKKQQHQQSSSSANTMKIISIQSFCHSVLLAFLGRGMVMMMNGNDDEGASPTTTSRGDIVYEKSVECLLTVCEQSAFIAKSLFENDINARSILIQTVCSVEPFTENNNTTTTSSTSQHLLFSVIKLLFVVLTASDLNVAMYFLQDELMSIKLERLANNTNDDHNNNNMVDPAISSLCRSILTFSG